MAGILSLTSLISEPVFIYFKRWSNEMTVGNVRLLEKNWATCSFSRAKADVLFCLWFHPRSCGPRV